MNLKKRLTTVLVAATCVVAMTGAYAWFTDRVQADATATAGTLELKLENFAAANAENIKPGAGPTITYDLSNIGNKSADIREYFIVDTGDKTMTESIFEMYPSSVVTFNAYGIAEVADADKSKALIGTLNPSDNTQVIFEVPEYIMNGSGENRETEIAGTGETVVDSTAGSYVLVLKGSVDNTFGGTEVTMFYEAQAKQHRNTGASTWTEDGVKATINFANNANYVTVVEKQN